MGIHLAGDVVPQRSAILATSATARNWIMAMAMCEALCVSLRALQRFASGQAQRDCSVTNSAMGALARCFGTASCIQKPDANQVTFPVTNVRDSRVCLFKRMPLRGADFGDMPLLFCREDLWLASL